MWIRHRGRGRSGEGERGPPPRSRQRAGRGDRRLRGQVGADGRGQRRHGRGCPGEGKRGGATADEAARRPRGVSSRTRPQQGGGAEAAADKNEATGRPQGHRFSETSTRAAVGKVVAEEAARKGLLCIKPRPQKGEEAGPVAVNCSDGRGRSRCGQGRGGGDLGLPPRTRRQYGRGGCHLRGRSCVRRLRGMLLRTSPRPDGFRGCLLRTRLWEGGRAGAVAAGRPFRGRA